MKTTNQNTKNTQGVVPTIENNANPTTPAATEKRARAEKPIEASANTGKKKKKKIVEVKVDEVNAIATVKAITEKKDLKYKYPVETDDLDKRKKFRTEVRRKLAAFEKEITKIKKSNLPEDFKLLGKKEVEFAKFKKNVLATA